MLVVLDRMIAGCRFNLSKLEHAPMFVDTDLIGQANESFEATMGLALDAVSAGIEKDLDSDALRRFDAAAQSYVDALDAIQNHAESIAARQVTSLETYRTGVYVAILILAVAYLGSVVALRVWVVKRLLKPVQALAQSAEQAMNSAQSFRLPEKGPQEVRVLTRSLVMFAGNLEEQVRQRTVELEREIAERKKAETEADELHDALVVASRQAGKAEVATSVLHNICNTLNSVNISVSQIETRVQGSQAHNLAAVADLVDHHADDLATFVTHDDKGKLLPKVLKEIGQILSYEQAQVLDETRSLIEHVNHIKTVISVQQSYARVAVSESVSPDALFKDAIRLTAMGLDRHHVKVAEDFATIDSNIMTDKHKVLQILVNLITNAKEAMVQLRPDEKSLTLRTCLDDQGHVQMQVSDNGVGIAPENLTKVFTFGFTTKDDGHGYGLHGSALAAKELGGSLSVDSSGTGQGTMFTLKLPIRQPEGAVR